MAGAALQLAIVKVCGGCHWPLPLTEFYAHPHAADGREGICKQCKRARVQENRRRRRAHYLDYDRRRTPLPHRRAQLRASQERHPERDRARRLVHAALRAGRLVRGPCALASHDCAGRIEAHHDDYRRPLAVRWLCDYHHGVVHRVDAARRQVS